MSKRKKHKTYSKEVKLRAVKMFLEEGKSVSAIKQELKIHDRNRVYGWTKLYQEHGVEAFTKKRKLNKEDNPQAYIKQLEMEVALLKKFHAELRKDTPKKQNTERSITTGKSTQ
jgi:transposase-like protein